MTNTDQHELNKFRDMAAQWWDPKGQCQPLHDMNPLRMRFIENTVTLPGARVLDVGCGGGILSEALAKSGAHVTGLDASEDIIAVATLHAHLSPGMHIDYHCSTIEALPFTTPFDVITCLEMLEHVPDPASVIHACHAQLKPGGDLFLSTLNRTLKSYLFAVVGAEYVLRLLPKGTHDYAKFLKPSEIDRFLRQAGFELKTLQGVKYNPFTKQFSFTTDVSVNYLVHAVKCR